jgi:dihydroneopterin aldolase/D-erythro-7,8-dihydroneopterin triphosphate epimerase
VEKENGMMDKIYVRDLLVRCIVGIYDWEKEKKQDVLINIVLYADLTAAGNSDKVKDTIDYKKLKNKIVAAVEERRFSLIEAIAELVSEMCLADPKVHQVEVLVDKPGALRFARSVAVEITRGRKKA